jgi:asparagine synthase (glutamine-hydrolysing)
LKHLLKRAAGDLVPRRILGRKEKMGFPVPLHKWIRGQSREFVHDVLLSSAARQRGIFDPQAVEAQLEIEPPFSRRLWGMLNLELWYRRFIDAPVTDRGSRHSSTPQSMAVSS